MQALVVILMATYNGEQFLAAQLDSIVNQTHGNFQLWVSDDGSTDGTIDILKRYQAKIGDKKMQILQGPQQGCR